MKSKGFMKFVWGGKQAVMGEKPAIKELEKDPVNYDLIIIGTPVWAGRPAPPIKTFMEDLLPQDKDLAFFYTYEGGEGSTFQMMEKMAAGRRIIGKMGFWSPLKENREDCLVSAREWAVSLLK
jgi:flavodoxin